MKKHKWAYCGMCGETVICRTCGNNTCNGGFGMVNGYDCFDCESAYEFMENGRKFSLFDTLFHWVSLLHAKSHYINVKNDFWMSLSFNEIEPSPWDQYLRKLEVQRFLSTFNIEEILGYDND